MNNGLSIWQNLAGILFLVLVYILLASTSIPS